MAVVARAHAKINLDLRVLGTRPDGYHELRTVFQAVALHDTITCIPREGAFAIECDTAGVPLDRSNLVWKAAEVLWRSIRRPGPPRDVLVRLEKRIPLQAGLGGGSADAAATLLALVKLWRVPVRPSQLTDIAATLGADVPFFLSGGTALGLGRGDEVYPLADLPRHWIVLVIPGFGVSSADAYAWYDSERDMARGGLAVPRGADDQRPRGADRAAPSRNRPDEDRPSPGRGPGGGHVGQRIDGLRPVSAPEGRRGRGRTALRRRLARGADRIARPGGIRQKPGSSQQEQHGSLSGALPGPQVSTTL
jgi:4-diphosphocytidyl-2C-methyl-D-erythritol kinase